MLLDGDLLLCTPGGKDGAIAALEKATGKVRWRATELDDTAHYSSILRAEINGQPQYVQLLEKRLVGVSPDDGKLLWQSEFPGRVAVIPTPIVHGNKVFATAGYGAGCTLVEISPDNVPTELYDEKARKRMKNHHGGVILPRRLPLRPLGRRRLDLHGLRHRRAEVARARGARQRGDRLRRRHVLLPLARTTATSC